MEQHNRKYLQFEETRKFISFFYNNVIKWRTDSSEIEINFATQLMFSWYIALVVIYVYEQEYLQIVWHIRRRARTSPTLIYTLIVCKSVVCCECNLIYESQLSSLTLFAQFRRERETLCFPSTYCKHDWQS